MSENKTVRVRFAPSPTGFLHVGGVRTALFNYLFARKHSGTFILRIEDTDQVRYVEGAEQYIIESLKWAGIEYDEGPGKDGGYGPYRQSERKEKYGVYAQKMIDEGTAYYAFDTPEELEAMRERMKKAGKVSPKYDYITREYMRNSLTLPADEVKKLLEEKTPYVVRIKIPRNEEIKLKDEVRGWVAVQSNQLDDKVLLKADGMPTYHLANVVDDYLMKVTHVIRGEEWLPSAPLHVLLYKYLGWEENIPFFAHLPLILKPDGKGKLSKRDGEKGGFPVAAIRWTNPETGEVINGYREAGYFPEAFINILAMLGWSPGDEQEIFTMQELIKAFSLERVGKSGAKFDPDKARWFNQQFMRKKNGTELSQMFKPILEEHKILTDDDYLVKVCDLLKEKATFITEFWGLGHYFFERPKAFDDKVITKKWDDKAASFFSQLIPAIQGLSSSEEESLEAAFKQTAEDMGEKPGKYMQLFRMLLSGASAGPALFAMASVLGIEEVVARLQQGLDKIQD